MRLYGWGGGLRIGVVSKGRGVESWGEERSKKSEPDPCQIVN